MAVQTNRNFMTAAEFQKRFPNLYNQQQAQQGAFGAPLGSGTPYQSTTPGVAAGNAPVTTAPLDITSPLNLGAGVYGNASTPSNLATSMYGDAALGTLPGGQTAQPAFGSIAQPITQTGQAAFGNIAQPLTASSLAEEVVGLDGKKVDANDSGMTDQMIEQLQVAEDARLKQVMREEEAKKLAAEEKVRQEEAAEAALTTEQRVEKYTPKLQQQILGQKLTDKWSGEGHGGAEANAKDMARILSSIGINDIRQFGKIKKKVSYTDEEGQPYTREIEVFGNKVTGQEVPNTYGERQTGNAWGGTYAGKGNTGYRVQFTEDGTPVFYTTYTSSSDLHKLGPLLAIASFIPGLQPFAMAANALIAAKQGNILGALAGFTGLGGALSGIQGLTNASNALNFASAAKNKNILGMLSAGANLGGTDLDGLAKASGIGDVTGLAGLNLGGLGVSDALKAYRTVQALKSGDPSSIISAVGGYARDEYDKSQNQNAKGFASAADITRSLAGRQGTPERFEQFDLPSVDEDFASSYGLGRVPDDLSAALPELPKFGSKDLSALLPEMPSIDDDFPSSSPRSSVIADARSSRAKMNAGPASARTIKTGAGMDPAKFENYGGSRMDPNLMKTAAPYLGWDPSIYFPKVDIRSAAPTSALGNVPETGYGSDEQTYINMAPYIGKVESKSPGTIADVLSHELAHVGQVLSSKPGQDISKQYLRMADEAGMSTADRFNKPSDIKNFETTLNQSIKYINDKYGSNAGTYLGNPKAPLFEKLTDLAAIEMQTGKDLTKDPVLKETLFKDPKAVAMYNAMTIPRMSRLDPRDLPPGKVTSSDFPKGQVPFEFQLKNAIRRGKAEGGLTSLPRKRQLARA